MGQVSHITIALVAAAAGGAGTAQAEERVPAAAIAVSSASAAAAQPADAAAQPGNPPIEKQAPTAATASSSDNGSQPPGDGEIVVTAQRREERLQDVPISVTAINANQLTRNVIVTTNDLTSAVPGLLWGRSTNFSQPTIRGVGSRNASAGDEPNVATFIDGVYQPDQTGTLFELSNVERIEVLKGPQGTLFGRNATGGAINIITRTPSFDLNGGISGTYGRFNYYKVSGYLNLPIASDAVAANVAAVKYGDDGYVHNIYLNKTQGENDGTAIRGKILLKPVPDVTLTFGGLYTKMFNNVLPSGFAINGNNQARQSAPGTATGRILNPTNIPVEILVADQPYTTASAFVTSGRSRQWMTDFHLSWDFGAATLMALGSVANTRFQNDSVADNSPLQLSHTQYTSKNNYSNQELVLTSNGSKPFSWLMGITGFQSNAKFDPLRSISHSATTGNFTTVITYYGQRTRAFAAFAEATLEPVQRLFLTGGIRYNRDHKSGFNTAGATGVTVGTDKTWSNVSPRGVVRYEFNDNSNVYFSYAKGFKSGTYNAVTATGAVLPAGPETIDAFEAGIKSTIVPGIYFNAAAYHYNYKDLQVSTPVLVNGVSATTVQNAGRAHITGLEAALEARVTPQFHLNATVNLLRTKVLDFPDASVNIPRTTNGVVTNTGNLSVVQDVSGNQLIRSPKRTFTFGATYTVPVGESQLIFNGTAFFSSKYYFDLTNRVHQPAYEVVNASVTWRMHPQGGLYATIFAQNLTNQVYLAGNIITAFGDSAQANKPRWFGGTIGFDF